MNMQFRSDTNLRQADPFQYNGSAVAVLFPSVIRSDEAALC